MINSTKGSNEAVEQRLEKLEKANRRLTWIALAFGAGLILMFALAADQPAATPDTLRVKRVEVVDESGTPRITLGIGRSGWASVDLAGKDGILQTRLTVDAFGQSHLFLGALQQTGSIELTATQREKQFPSIRLFGTTDSSLFFSFDEGGRPGLVFSDIPNIKVFGLARWVSTGDEGGHFGK